MPIIYIHGVNTRYGYEYEKNIATREELLQHLILMPLAQKEDRFKNVEIVNPYWGDAGVNFMWNQATLPDVSTLEALGSGEEVPNETDFQITESILALAGKHQTHLLQLETLGPEEGMFKRAAQKNLIKFVEVIFSPIILSEMQLADDTHTTPEAEGILQALLAIAGVEVASDALVKAEVAAGRYDDEVMELLKQKILLRIEQLPAATNVQPVNDQLETLGSDWLEDCKSQISELFDRVKGAPTRVGTLAILDKSRERLHLKLSRFLGDALVYLNERGDKEKPGPIISKVLAALKTAPRNHSNEPFIVLTHSMGGNILYDILTYYDINLKVDVWISVASQVGQFEEMKIFKASDKELGAPAKVEGLKSRVSYWLNVYDPADILSFKAAPVFADVSADLEYSTGVHAFKSHSEYFGRSSFYRLLRWHIEKALL